MFSAVASNPKLTSFSSPLQRANTTLLLVDDDATLLAVLKIILTRVGYNVLAASSPRSALDMAQKNSFGMLITDFQMPGMNGFTLASTLVESRASLPVLVLSGSDPEDLPTAEIAEHHWSFMAKPIDRQRLLEIIDTECLGSATLTAA